MVVKLTAGSAVFTAVQVGVEVDGHLESALLTALEQIGLQGKADDLQNSRLSPLRAATR